MNENYNNFTRVKGLKFSGLKKYFKNYQTFWPFYPVYIKYIPE